jgi:hypothetical protein
MVTPNGGCGDVSEEDKRKIWGNKKRKKGGKK